VQVGFFSNQANASKLVDKLLAKDFPAYIENSAGGYRVRVGKFTTQKEALDLEGKLSKEGYQTKVCP
jgi:cell division septation protein DedD